MSFALKLDHASMLAAARGRLNSFKWRVIMGLVFATGASLVLHSLVYGFGWFVTLCAAMGIDCGLGKRFLEVGESQRKQFGLAFMAACAATICVFATMTVWVAAAGGPAGRVLSVLMSASSLVSVMLFLFQAPLFMLITAVPCTICLLVVPLIPFVNGDGGGAIESGLGLACGVGAFLAYVVRAAINNGKMFKGLEAANANAQERAEEAEVKRSEAETANRTKSEFLTTMTHELRTPLNAVIGYSEIIQEDMEAVGRDDLAEDATRITASAKHLLGLIDQILKLSTMDAARAELKPGDVDLKQMVQAACAGFGAQAQSAGNRIVCRVAPDIGFAYTDGEKLGLCVAQLLSNAVKFTHNGIIAVNAESEVQGARDWVRITVSDTGIGMTQEEIAKAFQPFTQLDGSTTRAQGGMGLGLTITLCAARLLGGDVIAASEPRKGSTFVLRVPRRMAPETAINAFEPIMPDVEAA